MEESNRVPAPPARLFERLSSLIGYTWDQTWFPFHSSYDNWHVFGIKHIESIASKSTTLPEILHNAGASHSSGSRPVLRHHITAQSDAASEVSVANGDKEQTYISVVACISSHSLRLEREYQLCKSLHELDPGNVHCVRPIDFVTLPPQQGDRYTMVASVFESPGRNYLRDVMDFGPAFLGNPNGYTDKGIPEEQISLSSFLDFAIGACECLELLHHGLKTIHGELRADAFHFNEETGLVRLINFGSGPRSFENGLTSAGWLTLSRELGVKNKLQFIAPEQTGRMPAEPDSRTDIYSLGVLFWTLLTQEPAYPGETPIDVVQAVLSRKIPLISTKRLDVPEVVAAAIEMMTRKQIDERYKSMSGLRFDLESVRSSLRRGDRAALESLELGTHDVSSFFVLPTMIFGRQEQHDAIVKVIEKAARRQRLSGSHSVATSSQTLSTSSISDGRHMSIDESDTSSHVGSDPKQSNPYAATGLSIATRPPAEAVRSRDMSAHGEAEPQQSNSYTVTRPSVHPLHSQDTLDSTDSGKRSHSPDPEASGAQDSMPPTNRSFQSNSVLGNNQSASGFSTSHRRSQRIHRKGRCAVITIIGAHGLGKTSLIQNVQGEIRRRGYFTSGKFDQAQRTPFEPVLRAVSSLFRQIFSEADLSSQYHQAIRRNVRGIWPSLCKMLDLPTNLIHAGGETRQNSSGLKPLSQQGPTRYERRDSASLMSTHSSISTGTQTSTFFRGHVSHNIKFMNTFLEVFRILSRGKLICLCLDDLQYADEESIELLTNLISSKLRIVIILTCREMDALPEQLKTVLGSREASHTKIQLAPLSETDVMEYVAATLHRPREFVYGLVQVCLEKTNGNPFYVRQMLEECYRKNCLWYSWKESKWEYDIDRVFSAFETQQYGEQLNTQFITKRLQQELPPTARSILAWASLLGSTFSFSCVQRLMSGEFDYDDEEMTCPATSMLFPKNSATDAVDGLQACVQAFILVTSEDDDYFRFSHDRYMQASSALRECHNLAKMHFIICQTLMKYFGLDERGLYNRAQHICQAAKVIKDRILHRSRFREVLFNAGKKAADSGAKSTALTYFETCLDLIQTKPWEEGPDVYYDETISVYTKTAEMYWLQGRKPESQILLQSILRHACSAADKAPAWVIQSRIHAQNGDFNATFNALKSSLVELGLDFERQTTWEACDVEYKHIRKELDEMDMDALLHLPVSGEPQVAAMGVVMSEAVSAGFWSDPLLFYQMAIKIVSLHLRGQTFVQIGLGFPYFACVGMNRFQDADLARRAYDLSTPLMRRYGDAFTLGRGLCVNVLFFSHLLTPLSEHLAIYEEAVEYTLAAGDKTVYLLAIGLMAMYRLYLGHDMIEIESFCTYAPEDYGEWARDMRGGVVLTATRQVARALQGKTRVDSPRHVMSDIGQSDGTIGAGSSDDEDNLIGGTHKSLEYLKHIDSHASSAARPHDLYMSLALIPLYLFGHYEEAISEGTALLATISDLWSLRNSRLIYFYLSLSLLAKLRMDSTNEQAVLAKVREYHAKIEEWMVVNPVNYIMWSLLIEAESRELKGDYHLSIQSYEAAIDHTQDHGFALEEALALELQAGFYVRRGAKRAARTTLEDAIAVYTRIRATGKVEQLSSKFESLLSIIKRPRTVDAAVQTANSIGELGNTRVRLQENERQEAQNLGTETAGDRTEAWLKSNDQPSQPKYGQDGEPTVSDLGLDVLDLQSILEFNQAISSELQTEKLLTKMTRIILECAGADFASVVVHHEDGTTIMAASGTLDRIDTDAIPLSDIPNHMIKQIILNTLRFSETVFIQNVLDDERFSPNATAPKAVISLPIFRGEERLLGALYLEGQSNSFTPRNLGVLQLFCNQVSISITNAQLFHKVKKVSAANTSMIESQKLALAKAIEAENKAKLAEAEAIRNVILAEEAAKAKSMFLANISHELRTPLNGALGMSELLKGTSLSTEQHGYVDSIRVCSDTLLTVINDILDFSKLEAGKMALCSIPLNLYETITEVIRALSYTNTERELSTVVDLRMSQGLLVIGDPVRLHQIFMNLLSNAYKFTKPGGTVTVRSKLDYEDDSFVRVTCSVSDTGIGITPEQVARLFTPFSQADSSTQRSYGGTGLGLSICKALIGNMKGRIWLESDIGVGTTVFFTLVLSKKPDSSTPLATNGLDPLARWPTADKGSAPKLASSIIDLSKIPRDELRICIAEDNPINQKIAVSFVTKLGFNCNAFPDGKAAVEALRKASKDGHPYHLVLMDCQMPVLDGYDATKLIRKDDDPKVQEVLIIAMTASAIRGDKEKCLEAGMNNYLAKPVKAVVLKSMLESYTGQEPKFVANLAQSTTELANGVVQRAINKENASVRPGGPRKERPKGGERKPSAIRISGNDGSI